MHSLIVFETAGRFLGVPIGRTVEIFKYGAVSRLPFAPQTLLGLTVFKGEVYPLVSTNALLGSGEADGGWAIVAETETGKFALTGFALRGIGRFEEASRRKSRTAVFKGYFTGEGGRRVFELSLEEVIKRCNS